MEKQSRAFVSELFIGNSKYNVYFSMSRYMWGRGEVGWGGRNNLQAPHPNDLK